ncbi:hypothetical protein [Desulfosarcina ovata]|uniref:Organic solvent tolerance-like N-terminal domain-containing protein n=1 Tax=Desulfosarcina ovata subsp. ovata TaxID=2752305 RepID=A0A5K8AAP1_9BACT|nr:hypothetical protein [Desulfosarcina ovata]BBO89675.1 hypothetical protein DSCOOX_28550 [Desulfosarcina ovata subsp. ovata]
MMKQKRISRIGLLHFVLGFTLCSYLPALAQPNHTAVDTQVHVSQAVAEKNAALRAGAVKIQNAALNGDMQINTHADTGTVTVYKGGILDVASALIRKSSVGGDIEMDLTAQTGGLEIGAGSEVSVGAFEMSEVQGKTDMTAGLMPWHLTEKLRAYLRAMAPNPNSVYDPTGKRELVNNVSLSAVDTNEPFTYSSTVSGDYIYHNFYFTHAELTKMAKNPYSSQGNANAVVDKIWTLNKDGMGSKYGNLSGKLIMAFTLNNMAKDSLKEGRNEMGIQVRSRRDEGGKWALEFLDQVAGVWKTLAGK